MENAFLMVKKAFFLLGRFVKVFSIELDWVIWFTIDWMSTIEISRAFYSPISCGKKRGKYHIKVVPIFLLSREFFQLSTNCIIQN